MANRWRDWLRQAEAEMDVARTLQDAGHWAWACLASQQAAEKAVRAVLEAALARPPGHDLAALTAELQRAGVSTPTTVEQAALRLAQGRPRIRAGHPEPRRRAAYRLNRYYITTRYPDAYTEGAPTDKFTSADAEQAIEDAQLLLDFAREAAQQARSGGV